MSSLSKPGFTRLVKLSAIAVGVTCFLPTAVAQAIVYDSNGFEPTRFTTGALEGQDAAQGPWLRSGTGNATVQNSVVHSGTQAVQLQRTGSDVRFGVEDSQAAVVGQVTVEWNMNVLQTTGATFGPYMAVEAYDALGNSPLLIGSAGIDATTGELLYQEAGTGILTATGDVVAFGTWNHFRMVLDFDTDRYQVFLNGVQRVSEGFVDPGIADFTDAPLAALAAAGDPQSLSASGTAYYDNYRITAPVPEPGSLVALGFGALVILRRRHHRM